VARLAGRLAGVPVILGSERNAEYVRPRLHTMLLKLTQPLLAGIVANSNAGGNFAARTLSYPRERVHVVHNGVDVNRFRPDGIAGRAIRAELKLPAEALVVGMIASFKKQKRHEDFLAMAAELRKRYPNVWFISVGEPLADNQQGSGDHHAVIRQLLRELGLQDRCLFLGARKDVPAIYNACDLTILPSTREGTPNVVLESMACGVPVIASEIADNALIIKRGETGFLFDQHRGLAGRVHIDELVPLRPGRFAHQLIAHALFAEHQADLAGEGTERELIKLPHGGDISVAVGER